MHSAQDLHQQCETEQCPGEPTELSRWNLGEMSTNNAVEFASFATLTTTSETIINQSIATPDPSNIIHQCILPLEAFFLR
jgi:hypothetical protein